MADRIVKLRGTHPWKLWLLPLLTLAAFALRVYALGRLEFWFDEAISANVAALGPQGVLAYLRGEPFEHPPLFYLTLYCWQRLAGNGEFALRYFSVFWGVLSIPLLYILVRRLANRQLAVMTSVLATISPFMVAYSQETRMYTLLPCLALLLLLCFCNALERKNQAGWWLAYAALVAVGVTVHYYFALIWLSTAAYLLLERRRLGRIAAYGIAVQSLFLLAAAIWLVAFPGPRGSLLRVLQGETAFSIGYKLNKVMPTLILAEIRGKDQPALAILLTLVGWLLTLLGVWWSRRKLLLSRRGWLLLMLLLVIPLLTSLLIPYGVLGRHLGYTLVAVLPFMALALLALQQRGSFWLAAGMVAVLAIFTYGLVEHYATSKGDFGRAMATIDRRAQAGDLLILTQPAQSHLVTYYNRKKWPIVYVPSSPAPPTPAEVTEALTAITHERQRFWLGPIGAWTADPRSRVERWLAANAYQADKTWFPDSNSVSLYFSALQPLAPLQVGPLSWGGRISLAALYASPLEVAAGDALRLRFEWIPLADFDERYVVNLSLQGGDGQTWAVRRSEPCGGWCPTSDWPTGSLQPDQHALLIPAGTPPGTYELQIAWTPMDAGPALPTESDGRLVEQVTLARVTVRRPVSAPGTLPVVPNPIEATYGGVVTLLGYELLSDEVDSGGALHLQTHWLTRATPSADYTLLVELADRWRRPILRWFVDPVASFYPSTAWQAGEYLWGQQELPFPADLRPGRYRLRLALVDNSNRELAVAGELPSGTRRRLEGQAVRLAYIRVTQRARQFKLPGVMQRMDVTVGQNAHLVGYDLDQGQAYPGGLVELILYWRADGPMVKRFKVFTHLIDAEGTIVAQHDGQPGDGCCPANTWVEGEIVIDRHSIPLGADLSPGVYSLVAGMYDEESLTRLPTTDGEGFVHDRALVAEVSVERAPAAVIASGASVSVPATTPLATAAPTTTGPHEPTAAPSQSAARQRPGPLLLLREGYDYAFLPFVSSSGPRK